MNHSRKLLRGTPLTALLLLLLSCALPSGVTKAQAQASAPARENPATTATDAAAADLSITARVTARSLRFEKVPNPKVEFTGRPRRETVWDAERENIPAQVRPGETYRDIGITLRITSVFADIDRIVAEALGEVPPTEDDGGTRPTQSPPPDAPPPSAPPSLSPSPDAARAPVSPGTKVRRRVAPKRRGK